MFKILKELSKYPKFLRNARSSHTTRERHNFKITLCFASSQQIQFQQLRQAHTDIKVPNFDKHRRKSLSCANVRTYESEENRKAFSYMVLGMACTAGLYGVKVELLRYIKFMAASAEVLAMAKIEINLADIPEGKSMTFKWRGKPLFIRHRSQPQIDGARAVPVDTLRDPATDESRCPNPSWLIVLGVCTHLGCVPMADLGDFGPGGYYCPCHGAHYDAAGRTRKGPAPLNLAIPEHKFVGENSLIVG